MLRPAIAKRGRADLTLPARIFPDTPPPVKPCHRQPEHTSANKKAPQSVEGWDARTPSRYRH